jgi:Cd2+/Zn2+-exporting ATPase
MLKDKDGFEGKLYMHPPMRNALTAGALTTIAFVLAHLQIIPPAFEVGIYIIAILIGAYHWAREGIEELFECKEVGIEILMLAAAVGSAILGMWDEAAFLVFIYGVAEGLEEYAYARARASIRKLLDLAPKEAKLIKHGTITIVPAESLQIDDVFMVKPGESIATDGIILKGSSSINEAPVTGESVPVEKTEGMRVFAATINKEGVLEVRVTATFANNTLSKIVHLVEEAQDKKGKAQLFIDKFGKIYSPLVLVVAAGFAIVPLLFDVSAIAWATRAVVLLVAAAPCALIMSTPVAVAAGIGRAGRDGVLIKGGIYLENLGKIKAVAFDKTGTLTKGEPIITDLIALQDTGKELLAKAAGIEQLSEHPLAEAVMAKAKVMNIRPASASNFRAIPGFGTQAQVGNEIIYIGKPKLFEQFGMNINLPQAEELRRAGKTIILIGTKDHFCGIIGVRDEIRPQAKTAVKQLHDMGIKVVMLTGDNEGTAKAIAAELNIDDVRADLKPEEKINAIRDLESLYGKVAMVGDGINDAPALAGASVGIVMGTAGTDAAIEAADVALMADDLTKVSYAISLGKKARRISIQNITFSLLLLLVLIPSALIGVITIALAVFIHEGSELLAVVNGLRVAKK